MNCVRLSAYGKEIGLEFVDLFLYFTNMMIAMIATGATVIAI